MQNFILKNIKLYIHIYIKFIQNYLKNNYDNEIKAWYDFI